MHSYILGRLNLNNLALLSFLPHSYPFHLTNPSLATNPHCVAANISGERLCRRSLSETAGCPDLYTLLDSSCLARQQSALTSNVPVTILSHHHHLPSKAQRSIEVVLVVLVVIETITLSTNTFGFAGKGGLPQKSPSAPKWTQLLTELYASSAFVSPENHSFPMVIKSRIH